jgi:O-antigen ligase
MGSGVNKILGDRAVGKAHRVLLGLPLVLLPLLLGGARPWFWSCIAGIFAVGLAWSLWSGPEPRQGGNLSKKWLVGLGLFLLYPLCQTLPLSAAWIAQLSPHLMLWRDLAREVALAPSRYFSISYSPLVTFFSLLWWLFLVGYGLLFRKSVRGAGNLNWLYNTLFWVAGFEAFYGLLQTLIPSLGVLWFWEPTGAGLARGTFVNRNHYAAFLGMLWPVLLGYLLSVRAASQDEHALSYAQSERQKKARQKNWFLGFVIGLALLGLFFSQSRGGILGALIASTVFVVFGRKQHKKQAVVFFLGCWLVMFVYGSIIGFHGIVERFDGLEKDAPPRLNIWGDSLRLIQDHWLTGTGLGTHPEVIRLYQSHLTDQYDVVHAHSDYLELAAELGVPVAVVMTLALWGYWWASALRIAKLRKTVRSRGKAVRSKEYEVRSEGTVGSREEAVRSKEYGVRSEGTVGSREHGVRSREQGTGLEVEKRRLLALGALAGSAAFLCHCWVEFNWQIPANQLYFIVLLLLMRI